MILRAPIEPMLATPARTVPHGDGWVLEPKCDGWVLEPKWDGFRALAHVDEDRVRLFTSRSARRS